jgi:hypothetical protein
MATKEKTAAAAEKSDPRDAWRGIVGDGAFSRPGFATIPLDKIRIDGGTQQRPLVAHVIDEYAGMIGDGSRPPRVGLMFDGDAYWLFDGFHRYHAMAKAETPDDPKTLDAYVYKGDVRDAVFLSYAANKDHGVRRQPGVVGKIVAEMLGDPKWGKASASAIAAHVGVTQRYVERIKSDLREKKRAAGAANGNGDRPNGSDDEPTTRRVKRGDVEYDMNVGDMSKAARGRAASKSNDAAADAVTGGTVDEGDDAAATDAERPTDALGRDLRLKPVTVDAVGNVLVRSEHVDVFTRAAFTRAHMNALSKIKSFTVAALGDDSTTPPTPPDALYAFMPSGFAKDIDNARYDLAQSLPHALCPAHADDDTARAGCKWCQGLGFVNKNQYQRATEAKNAPADPATAGKSLSEMVAATEDKPVEAAK